MTTSMNFFDIGKVPNFALLSFSRWIPSTDTSPAPDWAGIFLQHREELAARNLYVHADASHEHVVSLSYISDPTRLPNQYNTNIPNWATTLYFEVLPFATEHFGPTLVSFYSDTHPEEARGWAKATRPSLPQRAFNWFK
jgi:hypothetical protein